MSEYGIPSRRGSCSLLTCFLCPLNIAQVIAQPELEESRAQHPFADYSASERADLRGSVDFPPKGSPS